MAKRGRKHKPTAQLRLAGSWRAKGRADDLVVQCSRPAAPEWLTGEPRTVFDELADQLIQLSGLLTEFDAEALAQLSQAIVEFRVLSRQLAAEGYSTETAGGGVKVHPLIHIRQQAWNRCRAGFTQFGLNPSDRAGLNLQAPRQPRSQKSISLGPEDQH